MAKEISSDTEHRRAWTWQDGSDPACLILQHVTMPRAGPGAAVVRNAVIGLNPVDWKILGAISTWRPGHVPGVDGAGTVVATGEGVPKSLIGQRVVYHQNLQRDGSFADYTLVDARALIRLPDAVGFEIGASFPCPALTAWLALGKVPQRANGQLLIGGAGGSVGQYLVQLATLRGWCVTTMSHARHWDRLAALGAQICLPGPLRMDAPMPAALAGRFHAAIDLVSGEHAAGLARALRANGHLVAVQDRPTQWPTEPFSQAISLHEVALGGLHVYGDDADWADLVGAGEEMLAHIADDSLLPEPEFVIHPFEALAERLNALKHRDFSGKALIRL